MPKKDEYSQTTLAEWKGMIGAKVDILLQDKNTIFRAIDELKQRVTRIETKAAIYGAVGGTVVGIIVFLIKHLMESR